MYMYESLVSAKNMHRSYEMQIYSVVKIPEINSLVGKPFYLKSLDVENLLLTYVG